jgi:hypothetical protein|nr:MAG TPA: Protein of unknown function (DUF1642) [Caudoviricetes sp.]
MARIRVPDHVGKYIDEAKNQKLCLDDAIELLKQGTASPKTAEWLFKYKNMGAFARAWLDGFETPSEIQLTEGETELEYYERILKMLPLYPTPLLTHAMAYVSTKIDRLKEVEKRKLDSKEVTE